MKKYRIGLTKMILCSAVIVMLTSCWDARELDNISIVVGLGIDKGMADNTVLLTAQIVKPEALKGSTDQSSSSQAKAYWNVQSTGETIFDAIREFTHVLSQKLYVSHNDVLILSKEIAAEGVQKQLDFFIRSNETRPTMKLFVSNNTAAEILDVQPQLSKLTALNMSKLIDAQVFTSNSKVVILEEFINCLLSKTTSAVAPIISVTDNNNEKTLSINGLAVFKGDQMVGQLNPTETRGLLWVTGDVKTGVLDIPYKDGIVSIEIKKATGKLSPEFIEDKIIMHVSIQLEGILVSQTNTENLATIPAFEELKKLINIAIENEIFASLMKAQELNTDIFGFGEKIHEKDRKKWKELEPNWDAVFSILQLELEVYSHVRGTGHATKPTVPESLE